MTFDERKREFEIRLNALQNEYGFQMTAKNQVQEIGGIIQILPPVIVVDEIPGWQPPPTNGATIPDAVLEEAEK